MLVGAERLRRQRIDRERMLRIDRLAARREKRRAASSSTSFEPLPSTICCMVTPKRCDSACVQLEAVAVGIASQIGQRRLHRGQRLRRYPARVLVRRQLDDRALVEPSSRASFGDRLARLIGRNRADVGGRLARKDP